MTLYDHIEHQFLGKDLYILFPLMAITARHGRTADDRDGRSSPVQLP